MKSDPLFNLLEQLANVQGDRTAISTEKGDVSYRTLLAWSCAVRSFLRDFYSGRIVVYIALPGGAEFTAIQLGTMASGNIAVPIPQKMTPAEAERLFDVVKPDVVCVSSLTEAKGILDRLPPETYIVALNEGGHDARFGAPITWKQLTTGQPPTGLANPAGSVMLPPEVTMIQFTSGSTGSPKGIALGTRQIAANYELGRTFLEPFATRQVFIPVPQFHAMGNALVLEHLLAGCEVMMANGIMPGEHLQRMRQSQLFSIHANPTYFRVLLQMESFNPANLPELRHFMIGSDWIDSALITGLRSRFPNITLHCRYGLSEAYGAISYRSIEPGQLFTEGQLGEFLPGVEFLPDASTAIPPNQPSALRVKSPTMATHQLMPDRTLVSLLDESGFINTGDLVYHDEDQRLILAGRASQFIKVNGHRISPFEIEDVLRSAPGVEEACVSGVPDRLTGQRIIACITPTKGSSPTAESLRKQCAAQLTSYKIPSLFLFDVEIPRTPSGKIARAKLSELLQARL